MKFVFNKTVCKNLRKSLRKEWLETNGLGSYASSSLVCCNTRKYHGLLVVKLNNPPGRYVLLSTLEETLKIGKKEFSLSCRKHPEVYHPCGHEFLDEVSLGIIPTFIYRFGDISISKQIMMIAEQNTTLIRYGLQCGFGTDQCATIPSPIRLRLRPLLAYRNMHTLTSSNIDLHVKTWPVQNGFCVKPYHDLPPLFMQASKPPIFHPSPDWYYNVEYMIEASRGFANHEDLFQPGVMDVELQNGQSIIISTSTEDLWGSLEELWNKEEQSRLKYKESSKISALENQLRREGQRFIVKEDKDAKSIVAGYHWFEAWGRDACIAIFGLTFASQKPELGWNILNHLAKESIKGQIPNMFSADGNHSYNCIDASLWFGWASQLAFKADDNSSSLFKEYCWPFIKSVISNYASGAINHVHCDAEGFLHVGSKETQLTWMDASVHGRPVTPRHGCPVEINALWYNLLAFAGEVASFYGEDCPHKLCEKDFLQQMQKVFKERFWVEKQGNYYLADCWRPDEIDDSLRPNQLFALGLPYPILEQEYWGDVLQACRNSLLTPFGLRTLAPNDFRYQTFYKGSPEQRDSAYHQGTVWTWLLGIYGDALLRVAWDMDSAVRELLEIITPLLTTHLTEAGIGTVSEIFMADPPYLPDGCVAQAWSVAELIRLLANLRQMAPEIVNKWEEENISNTVTIEF